MDFDTLPFDVPENVRALANGIEEAYGCGILLRPLDLTAHPHWTGAFLISEAEEHHRLVVEQGEGFNSLHLAHELCHIERLRCGMIYSNEPGIWQNMVDTQLEHYTFFPDLRAMGVGDPYELDEPTRAQYESMLAQMADAPPTELTRIQMALNLCHANLVMHDPGLRARIQAAVLARDPEAAKMSTKMEELTAMNNVHTPEAKELVMTGIRRILGWPPHSIDLYTLKPGEWKCRYGSIG